MNVGTFERAPNEPQMTLTVLKSKVTTCIHHFLDLAISNPDLTLTPYISKTFVNSGATSRSFQNTFSLNSTSHTVQSTGFSFTMSHCFNFTWNTMSMLHSTQNIIITTTITKHMVTIRIHTLLTWLKV